MCAELDRERAALLLEVSRMYWEEQLDQRTIAQRAGYSRPTVSRMLAEARREGIVTIVVAHPVERLMRLEERLKSAFGLVQARVTQDVPDSLVPTGGISHRVARAAGEVLLSNCNPRSVIAVSNGRAVGAVVHDLPERT